MQRRAWDQVFVLCTGRCGSTTFFRAMEHATNYSAGHETRTHMLGDARFDYPKKHVEADNRLSWLLGRLDARFGDRAFYAHLTRDPEAVAQSFAGRANRGIMLTYRTEILMGATRRNSEAKMLDFARDYVYTITANIENFLRDKPSQMAFQLEEATDAFPEFWDHIAAEGDLTKASGEFAVRHNASH